MIGAELINGTTTKQIKDAPLGAIYVWPTADVLYPKRLAEALGRSDLKIVGPSWLKGKDIVFKARHVSGVIDHAVMEQVTFTDSERELIRAAQAIWND